ncbi:S1C family serine protease [Streptomyces sp. 6-11-2]|uniref:S1C family serine protease n=1 Tax=Streptomyces sp. 6-11-2 TaxID=2585753 RepID=UPI00114258E3|nr:trypsin-like peptidase domain-containing protein [Streptomyces sp. 6-11-2]GED86150.1 protease [Streptomyces sp. 6-11-2]
MTESIRRSGEYEHPQGDGQAPAADSVQSADQQRASAPVNPEWPPPPPYIPAQPFAAGPGAHGGQGGANDGGTAVFPAVPAGPAHASGSRKRTRGPLALLAAVAIASAVVGGGTAYAFQELTGTDTVASSTTTNVVASSQRGSIAAIAKAVTPSVVEINATLDNGTSTGSGVVVTSDGEVVTNNHVIAGASSIKVRTSDGTSYTAQVVGTDSSKDLALIKLRNASGLKAAVLGDSDGLTVGDQVVAIGSPEGLTGTVTSGIVSALHRDVTVSTNENQGQQGGGGGWPFQFGGRQFNGDTGSSTTTYQAIQTDASLNPGNSGGALIDASGNIVGINSAMYSATQASDSSSAGSVGLGFAIPINTVKSDLATLRSGSQS